MCLSELSVIWLDSSLIKFSLYILKKLICKYHECIGTILFIKNYNIVYLYTGICGCAVIW